MLANAAVAVQSQFAALRFQSVSVAGSDLADQAVVWLAVIAVPVADISFCPVAHVVLEQKDVHDRRIPYRVHQVLIGHAVPARFVYAINAAELKSALAVHKPVVQIESVAAKSVQHFAAISAAVAGYV